MYMFFFLTLFFFYKFKNHQRQAPRVVGSYTHHGVWASRYQTGITQGVPVEGEQLRVKIR